MSTGYNTTNVHLTTDIMYRMYTLEQQVKQLTELMLMYSFGLGGHEYVAAEASSTSGQEYVALLALEDTTVTYTEANSGTITDQALKQGDVVYGVITSVSVAADGGSVRLYKRDPKVIN